VNRAMKSCQWPPVTVRTRLPSARTVAMVHSKVESTGAQRVKTRVLASGDQLGRNAS
jgi:hypothetical protein